MTDFVTKDSGERQVFSTGMHRDSTKGKERPDLVRDGPMFRRWIQLMTRGAEKYEARNWMKACTKEELERAYESADRHYEQWRRGETDEDHGAAVMFGINLVEYIKDRQKEQIGPGPCSKWPGQIEQHRWKGGYDISEWSEWHDVSDEKGCKNSVGMYGGKDEFRMVNR